MSTVRNCMRAILRGTSYPADWLLVELGNLCVVAHLTTGNGGLADRCTCGAKDSESHARTGGGEIWVGDPGCALRIAEREVNDCRARLKLVVSIGIILRVTSGPTWRSQSARTSVPLAVMTREELDELSVSIDADIARARNAGRVVEREAWAHRVSREIAARARADAQTPGDRGAEAWRVASGAPGARAGEKERRDRRDPVLDRRRGGAARGRDLANPGPRRRVGLVEDVAQAVERVRDARRHRATLVRVPAHVAQERVEPLLQGDGVRVGRLVRFRAGAHARRLASAGLGGTRRSSARIAVSDSATPGRV